MSDTVQLPGYAQRKPLSVIDPTILPEGFKPISLVLPALPLCWLFGEYQAHKHLTGLPGNKSYVDMLFATAAMWGDFREADATERAKILHGAFYLYNTRPSGWMGATSYLLGVGWNAERAEIWAPTATPFPLAARTLAYLCGEHEEVDFDSSAGRVFDAHKLTQGWSSLRHERTVGIARNVEVLWTASHDRREPGWGGRDWEERLLTRALIARPPRLDPAECIARYNSTIGPTWWHRGPIEPAAPSEGPPADAIGPAQAALLEIDLTSLEDDIHDLCDHLGVAVEDDGMIARERLRALAEVLTSADNGDVYARGSHKEAYKLHPGLEDTVSELCDHVGIPVTDDATPLARLLQLRDALTSTQAQSGADPQMMLSSLAVSLIGLFDLLGVPALDGERGLTLHERANRAVTIVRQGKAKPQAEGAAHARLTASEEERQHLTAQLQQARTSVDAWSVECSRLAGQVTDLQARLAAAVEDAGSGVQARVAHALRTELNQVGILMSQGYLSPEMHAAVARVHWLMDLYHGPR